MTGALPVLYSFRRCPYAMRARMACLSAGIKVEIREILLRDKPAEMLEASPKGTVPVLVLPDGRVIDQSIDIMIWALDLNDPEHWLSGYDAEAIAHNDGTFKMALDRYKYANRFENETIVKSEQRDICAEILQSYEARLSRTKFLTGDGPSITDNAIFPFVRQFANVDREWFDTQPWSHLHAWLIHFIDSTRFEMAMRTFAPWKLGDKPVIFSASAP
ncbi:MAG: glutathione S-transferase [Ahrensia sp.]|nr:glutathione S-transferase [Ahrensia sp.]